MDENYDKVMAQHQELYAYIQQKYNEETDKFGENVFHIGITNMDSQVKIGYNYIDKVFLLIVNFDDEVMIVNSFTTKKEFLTIVNLLIYDV
jgi:hypothetical protein